MLYRQQSRTFPLVLIFGGIGFALYFVYEAIFATAPEPILEFAISCIVAVIGWQELQATQEHNEW